MLRIAGIIAGTFVALAVAAGAVFGVGLAAAHVKPMTYPTTGCEHVHNKIARDSALRHGAVQTGESRGWYMVCWGIPGANTLTPSR